LTFDIAAGLTAAVLGTIPARVGSVQRALSGMTVLVGACALAPPFAFFPTTVIWLGIGSAAAMVGLAVTGRRRTS
jgi:ABC-type nitrate/sulfonate/bicarbonate transport system permease component